MEQVTDMMIANSSNLIITVKPANQRAALTAPRRGSFSRNSQLSSGSHQSTQSVGSDEEADEIVDLTGMIIITKIMIRVYCTCRVMRFTGYRIVIDESL